MLGEAEMNLQPILKPRFRRETRRTSHMATRIWERPLNRLVRSAIVFLACIGIVLPLPKLRAATLPLPGEPNVQILDIELGQDGRLTGTVVDGQQNPLSQPVVVVAHPGGQRRPVVARNGDFFVDALPGGVYLVVTTGATVICRCWTFGTAPPSAVPQLNVVAGDAVPIAGSRSIGELFLSPPALIGISLIIAVGIAIPIAIQNSKSNAS